MASYDDNVITAKEWFVLQALGCVFLPAAGVRLIKDNDNQATTPPGQENGGL